MKIETIGIGTATGKIILIGEHSVVYGEPAIAVPLPAASVTTTMVPSDQMTIDCLYFSGLLSETPEALANIKEAVRHTLSYLNKKEYFAFTITSSIPPERGMGSSAAVAISVIRSIFDYYHYAYTQKELTELTDRAEKIAHGNPSGIDAAAASGSQPLFFIKGQPFEPFPMNLRNTYLIVADTGIKGQTRAAVHDVSVLIEKQPIIKKDIHRLGELTEASRQAVLANDSHQLGSNMNQAQQILTRLTVSHPLINTLVEGALKAGAIGAKLTGGGRGGCVIALTDSFSQAKAVEKAFQGLGAVNTWVQSLEDKEK